MGALVGDGPAGPPDLMDWYDDPGPVAADTQSREVAASKGSLYQLGAWLVSGKAPSEDVCLLSRFVAKLRDAELSLDDLPNSETAEYRAFLEELSFGAVDRTKLRRALKEFRLW